MQVKIRLKIILPVLIAAALTAAICYILNNVEFRPEIISVNSPAQQKYVRILFVGDLMFDRGIRYYALKYATGEQGNEFIFDKINSELKSNDLVIANLEGPLTDNKSVSAGTLPGTTNNYFFTFDPSVAKTLFKENIKMVSLGNNHILNFGYAGLKSTKNYLDQAGVNYFGAPGGERSATVQINNIKIAFVSYNEFVENPVKEARETVSEVKNVKQKADVAIIYSHWGVEYSLEPTSAMQNLAHQFIDAGADLVVASHPHVVVPMEEYKGKRIYYSLGNFIFDQYFSEDVRNGLGVVLKINESSKEFEFFEKQFYLSSNGQTVLK